MKVDILGTNYEYVTDGDKEEYPNLGDDGDGYCNYQLKQIVISEEYDDETESYKRYLDKVKRHEVIHAYLYESGLHDYANDERIIDWLAIQFPKMAKTFEKLEIN